ncbi:ATP-dependent RNA helicase [Chloropicon primus]|uniref:RNA helicase n=2 Tax=Chloropicon primus TaxID=1764295 RepID=A0A5B8MK46_9CHLO|nr:ATP-dependent RNA helicase [Chloropicon primus]UPR00029.1 ATP-dependent RNA helicase [Chloropicon primus]|eukprot:QDZ20817.1 ATP-dependent RNA helicase [Chloropicon primus]
MEGGGLPISRVRRELLYLVEKNATVVVVGHTGCGKTTQIPQYLHRSGWTAEGSKVLCTQPRELVVVSVAHRVAEEMGAVVGGEVGYRASSFEARTDEGGSTSSIEFSTDEALVSLMQRDPLLSPYTVVMVDEAHERSLATDVVLGLLKKVQRRRPDLRVIISSATIDAEALATFFGGAAIVSVEGTLHDVDILYAKVPASSYISEAVDTVVKIHKNERPGDVLVFFPGEEDVSQALELIEEQNDFERQRGGADDLVPLALHEGMPTSKQLQALRPAPRNHRKVVLSTSVAETSLTIDGIAYVVDCCFQRERYYDPITSLESVVTCPESKASAVQRAGRAGRVRPGKCFRLCTREAYESGLLPESSVPEMQRSELSHVVLQLKALGVDNIMSFDWIAPPSAEAMVRALELLHALGALDQESRLTSPLGAHMAELPVHPTVAKPLLVSGELGCVEELLIVAAVMTVKSSVWQLGRGRKEMERQKMKFAVAEGDHVTYLNVYKGFLEAKRSPGWCDRHCVNYNAMMKVLGVKSQLWSALEGLGIKHSSSDKETLPVRKALAHGLFANSAVLSSTSTDGKGRATYTTVRGKVVTKVHESSVLHRNQPKCVLYTRAIQTGPATHEMFEVLAVEQDWLTELAPHFYTSPGVG